MALASAPAGYRTFGGGTGEVARVKAGAVWAKDGNGNPIQWTAWSKRVGGTQITDLLDENGGALPGVITVVQGAENIDEGMMLVYAPEAYGVIYIDRGYGIRVAVWAQEIASQMPTAIDRSNAAYDAYDAVADDVATLGVHIADLDDRVTGLDGGAVDIMTTRPTFITQLQPGGPQVSQDVSHDPATGQWFCCQNIDPGGGAPWRNLRINRLAPSGLLMDSMVAIGAGHGDSMSIQRVGSDIWVWITWETNDADSVSNFDFVRFKYTPSATLHRGDAAVSTVPKFDEPVGTKATFACDFDDDRMVVRKDAGYNNPATYVLRKISDVLSSTDQVLAQVDTLGGTPPDGPGTAQCFCTIDDSLYINYGGGSDSALSLRRYSWSSGIQDAVLDTTILGQEVAGVAPGGVRESEGVSAYRDPATGRRVVVMGMSMGDIGYRQAMVYAIAPPGVALPVGAAVQRLQSRVQSGIVTVTPTAANTPTSADIVFPQRFAAAPNVVATAATSVPGTVVSGVGVAAPTDTGFRLWVTRTNTTATYVQWIAVGP